MIARDRAGEARARLDRAPPETGSRTPRGRPVRPRSRARFPEPRSDPRTSGPRRAEGSLLFLRDGTRRLWKSRNGNESGPHTLSLLRELGRTSSARDNPDRSSATFIRLIVRDRRETPHSTPARVRSVAQKAHPLPETSSVKTSGRKRRTSRAEIHPDSRSACLADSAARGDFLRPRSAVDRELAFAQCRLE